MGPFKQGRFEELPDRPRVAHAYDRARGEDVELESSPFGRVRVHVRRMGSGPPLLLAHGLMTSSYSWRYVLEPLAEHFEVIAPDAFGRYLSDTLDPRELAAFAERLRNNPPSTPMLLLYARQDPMVPPSVGPRLAELLPQAKFAWLDESSHFAHVDTPELVLDHVLPFLR